MVAFTAPDMTKWSLVKPNERYLGLSYNVWFARWLQWLVSPDPDAHNNGNLLFLRGMDSQIRNGRYAFFLRFGRNRLRILEDQAIFLPIITYSADEKNEPNCETAQKRLSLVMKLMSFGDNPPNDNQATINGKNIIDADESHTFNDYQFVSPEFDLDIPDPADETYGTLLGPKADLPLINPGISKSVVGGYAFIIKDLKPGTYLINSYAHGELGYLTRTCVQIEVQKRIPTAIQQLLKGSESPHIDVIKESLARQLKYDDQLAPIAKDIEKFINH